MIPTNKGWLYLAGVKDLYSMESFWGLLKNELVYDRTYGTHCEAIADLTEYIEVFYNRQRRQAALGYLSPAAFVRKTLTEPLPAIAA